ncbi:unnamed protein product [Adineta steineri]|uniref:Endonuclease/exonuclease/phosphatase domain-containing protein n=2 Tax=Adineta steineri TaxID=433720 RepID=A0A814D1U3_9BILA|nr:unnamed protein product [Adineta steineri]
MQQLFLSLFRFFKDLSKSTIAYHYTTMAGKLLGRFSQSHNNAIIDITVDNAMFSGTTCSLTWIEDHAFHYIHNGDFWYYIRNGNSYEVIKHDTDTGHHKIHPEEIVRVCTFNLRCGHADLRTSNNWERRRSILKNCLENMQPTIIGTQEGYPQQLNEILDDLNESSSCWSYIGEEITQWRTINAIFYRHDILSLISTNTFWFNEHPLTFGAAWGAIGSRGCTRAHFQHKLTDHPFIIYNLHLDYPSQNARHHSIPVLLSQINQSDNQIDNVIVIGDFNNWPEKIAGELPVDELILLGQKASEIQQMKQAGFVDTYQHGEIPSFNGFQSTGYGPKIDFVWISSNSIYRVEGETKIDEFHDVNGFFPSDHFPVYADLVYIS